MSVGAEVPQVFLPPHWASDFQAQEGSLLIKSVVFLQFPALRQVLFKRANPVFSEIQLKILSWIKRPELFCLTQKYRLNHLIKTF